MGGGTDKKRRSSVGLPLSETSLDKDIVSDTVSDTRVLKDWKGKTVVEDRQGGLLPLLEVRRMCRLPVRCADLRDLKPKVGVSYS